MNWPQIVVIVLYVLGLWIELAKHGEQRTGRHNFVVHAVSAAIGAGILYAGGFWS